MFSAVQLQAAGVVVVSGYAPSVSTLADGNVVTVSGSYPFSDTAIITLTKPADLRLRVPCWSESATVRVGQAAPVTAPPCAFFNVSGAALTAASSINITFLNKIRLHEWKESKLDGQALIQGGGVEVHRGPLLFALRPESDDSGDLIHTQEGFPPIKHHTITIKPNGARDHFELTTFALPVVSRLHRVL